MKTLCALVLIVLTGCPSASLSRDPDPSLAVIAYRDALVAGRPADAFRWIHADARDGLDQSGFEALYLRHREALVAQAEELVRQVQAAAPAQRARVRTDKGDLLLDHGPEGWRLLQPVGRGDGTSPPAVP